MGPNWNPSEHEKELLYFEGDRTQKQTAQEVCDLSFFGYIQNSPGCFPLQPTVENPALEEWVNKRISKHLFQSL